MPTYDYVCEKCEHEFEIFQSMKDPRLVDCPLDDCDGHVRRKIGTGAGLIFKGSGFYETDYRSESYKEGAKKDSESGSSSNGDSKKSEGDSKKSAGDSGASKSSSSESKSSGSDSSASTSSSTSKSDSSSS
jgi:putative FmdB family regulatory protein